MRRVERLPKIYQTLDIVPILVKMAAKLMEKSPSSENRLHKMLEDIHQPSENNQIEVYGGDTFDKQIEKVIKSLREIEELMYRAKNVG